MFSLKLFGAPLLEGPEGPVTGRATQRRRVALLAVLALAGRRGVSRDRMVGLLWPESDTERARHLLSDSVYVLRKTLGEDAVLAAGDDLRLNPEVVRSDVEEFEEALSAGDAGRAAALYAGPLMDSFYPDDAPELERWLEGERGRLARSYARALESLAEGTDDPAVAAEWSRRLAVHDPCCSRYALGLMRALDAAGDRSGALQHARVHAAFLRSEFDAEPDPEVEALAERLRSEPSTPLVEARDAPRAAPLPEATPTPRPPLPPAVAPGEPRSAPPAPRPGPRPRVLRAALVALAFVVAVSAVWSVWQRRASGVEEVSASRIAVLPFSVSGGGEVAYLGEGMVDLLSTNLDDAGTLRSVDPRALLGFLRRTGGAAANPDHGRAVANHFGAGLYVLGSVVAQPGGRLRIAAALYDRDGGAEAVGRAVAEGEAGELFTLVDQLTRGILAALPGRSAPRLNRLAAVTTRSLPALKAFLEGEQQFRSAVDDASFGRAVQEFGRAVHLDSSFALAHYRRSVAAAWAGQMELSHGAAEEAFRRRDRLSGRDRQLLDAWRAMLRGASDEAEQGYRSVLGRYPDDEEAWFQLGDLLLRANPLRGRSVTEARGALQRVLSIQTTNGCARCNLMYVEMVDGNFTRADSLADGFDPPVPSTRLGMRAIRAAASGDRKTQEQILATLRGQPDFAVVDVTWAITVSRVDLDYAARITRLLTEPSRSPEWRVVGHLALAHLALAQGRVRAAEAELRSAERIDAAWGLEIRALLATLPFLPASPTALRSARSDLERWNGTAPPNTHFILSAHNAVHPQLRRYLLGLVSARLADSAAALRHTGELKGASPSSEAALLVTVLAGSIRAQVAAGAGKQAEALRGLERAQARSPYRMTWFSPFYAQGHERYLRAELLAWAGREEEALQWFRSFGEIGIWDLPYLAPAHLRQAEILERLGRREEAARHYARFVELWKEADPELRPGVARAEERLRALGGAARP